MRWPMANFYNKFSRINNATFHHLKEENLTLWNGKLLFYNNDKTLVGRDE